MPNTSSEDVFTGLWNVGRRGHAVIAGVCLDLRHPDLPPEKWYSRQVDNWWFAPFAGVDQPPLVFPWHERKDLDQRLAEWDRECALIEASKDPELADVIAELRRPATRRAKAARYRDEMRREIVVDAGDSIRISRIVTQIAGDDFAYEADRQRKLAFLELRRADGRLLQLSEPLRFRRRTSIHSNQSLSIDTIVGRICEANDIQYPFDLCLCAEALADAMYGELSSENTELTWPELLLERAQHLVLSLEAARASAEGKKPEFAEFAQTTKGSLPSYLSQYPPNVDAVARDALALGFLWKTYEAETILIPQARAGVQLSANRRRGGEVRGAYRQSEARTTRQIILELALDFRGKDAGISQERLAFEIQSLRPGLGVGHRAIVGHISELEKDGRLPRAHRSAPS